MEASLADGCRLNKMATVAVYFHFEAVSTREFMPGHRPQQDNPAVLAQHVIGLLRNSLGGSNEGIGC